MTGGMYFCTVKCSSRILLPPTLDVYWLPSIKRREKNKNNADHNCIFLLIQLAICPLCILPSSQRHLGKAPADPWPPEQAETGVDKGWVDGRFAQ